MAMALATAASLFRVPSLFSRNPFGAKEVVVLGVATWCAFTTWGFYQFLVDLLRSGGVRSRHPAHVAWWLAGGVWVTAAAVDLVVESSSHQSDAVWGTTKLGALLAIPLLAALIVASVRRSERVRSDWRAWGGVLVGCAFPLQYVLFFVVRG